MKNCLIINGTSHLGLKLARLLSNDYAVHATGRVHPGVKGVQFTRLDLAMARDSEVEQALLQLPKIDLCIYLLGLHQRPPYKGLRSHPEQAMLTAFFSIHILSRKQGPLPGLITVDPIVSWPIPRNDSGDITQAEIMQRILARDSSWTDLRASKTMVVVVPGFTPPVVEDASLGRPEAFVEPAWTAKQIAAQWQNSFRYRRIRVSPADKRVEVVS